MPVEVILYRDPIIPSGEIDFVETFPDTHFQALRQPITEGTWLVKHDKLTLVLVVCV